MFWKFLCDIFGRKINKGNYELHLKKKIHFVCVFEDISTLSLVLLYQFIVSIKRTSLLSNWNNFSE